MFNTFFKVFVICHFIFSTAYAAAPEISGDVKITEETHNKKKYLRVRMQGPAAAAFCKFLGVDLAKKDNAMMAVPAKKKNKILPQAKTCLSGENGVVTAGFLMDEQQATYDLEAFGYN